MAGGAQSDKLSELLDTPLITSPPRCVHWTNRLLVQVLQPPNRQGLRVPTHNLEAYLEQGASVAAWVRAAAKLRRPGKTRAGGMIMGCGGTGRRSGLTVSRRTIWRHVSDRPGPPQCADPFAGALEKETSAARSERLRLAACWRPDFSFNLELVLGQSRCELRSVHVDLPDRASVERCLCGIWQRSDGYRTLIQLHNQRQRPKPGANKMVQWATIDDTKSDNRFWYSRVLEGLAARLEPCSAHLQSDVELQTTLQLKPDGSVAHIDIKPRGKTDRLPFAMVGCVRPVFQRIPFPCPQGNKPASVTILLRLGHRKQQAGLY